MRNAKKYPPSTPKPKNPTKTKTKKSQKQRENGVGREGVGTAEVQGCCVSDAPARHLSLRGVRTLRAPSAGSRRRQSAYGSWAARGAEPRVRSATGCSGAASRDVSHPEGREFDFQAGCGGRRAADGAPGDTALLLTGVGALPPGGRARRDSPRAARSWQRGGLAEARQALSAERDAYKPGAAILSLLSGLPFPSPGAQCTAVAAVSPLALPLLGRPPGRQPGAAGEAPRESAHQPQPPQPWRFPCHLRPRCSGFAGCSADLLLIATTRQRFAAFSAAGASRYTFFCRPG